MQIDEDVLCNSQSVVKGYYAKHILNMNLEVFVVLNKGIHLSNEQSCPRYLSNGTPIHWINVTPTVSKIQSQHVDISCPINSSLLQDMDNVVASNWSLLYQLHSNLVSITTEYYYETWVICFTVTAKGFVPQNEDILPISLDGFKCIVREGVAMLCSGKDDWANVDIQNLSLFSYNDEASSSTSVYSDDVNNTDVEKENEGQNLNPLKHLRPLRPGAAICPEPLLDFRESTCATLGGFVKKNDNFYALTAAHLFSVHSPCKMSSDGGTFHDNCHVSQSCPFAMILSNLEDPFNKLDRVVEFEATTKPKQLKKWLCQFFKTKITDEVITKYNEEHTRLFGTLDALSFEECGREMEKDSLDIALIAINKECEVNTITLKSYCGLSAFHNVQLLIDMDNTTNCWNRNDFQSYFTKSKKLICYCFGCRAKEVCGEIRSYTQLVWKTDEHVNGKPKTFYFKDSIKVYSTSLDCGDSGSLVWSKDEGCVKIIGVVHARMFQGTFNGFMVIIPIWKCIEWFGTL